MYFPIGFPIDFTFFPYLYPLFIFRIISCSSLFAVSFLFPYLIPFLFVFFFSNLFPCFFPCLFPCLFPHWFPSLILFWPLPISLWFPIFYFIYCPIVSSVCVPLYFTNYYCLFPCLFPIFFSSFNFFISLPFFQELFGYLFPFLLLFFQNLFPICFLIYFPINFIFCVFFLDRRRKNHSGTPASWKKIKMKQMLVHLCHAIALWFMLPPQKYSSPVIRIQ